MVRAAEFIYFPCQVILGRLMDFFGMVISLITIINTHIFIGH